MTGRARERVKESEREVEVRLTRARDRRNSQLRTDNGKGRISCFATRGAEATRNSTGGPGLRS